MKRVSFLMSARLILACIYFGIMAAQAGEDRGNQWVAQVSGMSCPLCAKNIEKQVKKIMGVTEVDIDLGTGQVKIFYAAGFSGDKKTLTSAIQDAGFTVVELRKISP